MVSEFVENDATFSRKYTFFLSVFILSIIVITILDASFSGKKFEPYVFVLIALGTSLGLWIVLRLIIVSTNLDASLRAYIPPFFGETLFRRKKSSFLAPKNPFIIPQKKGGDETKIYSQQPLDLETATDGPGNMWQAVQAGPKLNRVPNPPWEGNYLKPVAGGVGGGGGGGAGAKVADMGTNLNPSVSKLGVFQQAAQQAKDAFFGEKKVKNLGRPAEKGGANSHIGVGKGGKFGYGIKNDGMAAKKPGRKKKKKVATGKKKRRSSD